MIKIIKNFINERERKTLNNWTLNNYMSPIFTEVGMDLYNPRTRLSTRTNLVEYAPFIKFPKEAYNIKKRIEKKFSLINYPNPNQFFNGIVNGIGFENGSIFKHVDPIYYQQTYTLHCNIISQKSLSGGITIINGKEYDVSERDLLCFIVSHQSHEVTRIIGNVPRILWCYGFCIDHLKMKNIFKL